MNNRFLLIFLSVFIFLSCSQYINLGDDDNSEVIASEDNYAPEMGDTGDYDAGDTDSKAEAGDYNSDSDAADSGDWGNTAPESDGGFDSGDSADWSDTADSGCDSSDTYDEVDSSSPYESDDSDNSSGNGSGYVFPEEDPFPEGFSNIECDCGNTPDYQPVCCDGMTLVFNACFANCYAVKSNAKICVSYENGLCPDSDDGGDPDGTPNECGCYPEEEPSVFRCGENSYFITSCLANCHCDGF